jgi:hypothetical protein
MRSLGRRRALRRSSADNAGWAVSRRRRQNNVGIDQGGDDLQAKPDGRNQIYRRIRLVEFGFRQVYSGYDRHADRRCQEKKNQHPAKSLHAMHPKYLEKYSRQQGMSMRRLPCQRSFGAGPERAAGVVCVRGSFFEMAHALIVQDDRAR